MIIYLDVDMKLAAVVRQQFNIYTYFDFSFLQQLLSVWPDLDLDFRSLKLYWLIQNVKKNLYHDLICWYHEILNV